MTSREGADEHAARAARLHLRVLTRVSAALATALESIDTAVDELADAVVPEFADWFALDLLVDGELRCAVERPSAAVAPPPDGPAQGDGEADAGGRAHLQQVIARARPMVARGLAGREAVSAEERAWRRRGLDTVVVAPVRVRGLTLGTVTVGAGGDRHQFTDADIELTGVLAGRIAVALERVEQHGEKERAARDAARQAARLRRLMESAVVLGGARSEEEVITRLAVAARRVSASDGASVTIARGPGAPVTTYDGEVPDDPVELTLFGSDRQRIGVLAVGRPAVDAEDFELALVALAQIGGALIENRRLVDGLERSRTHLQALVDASPDAMLEVDAGGLILTANRSASAVLGTPVPRSLNDVLDDAGKQELHEALAKAAFDEAPPRFEVRAERGADQVVLSIALAPLLRGDQTERIVALVSDVTEQRRLEEQLLRAQRMEAIGQLAGGIAHDFNNLITAVIGFGELAGARLPADHEVQDDLAEVISAGRRAADLTAQLLSFGRGQRIERTALDVADLFEGMRAMLERVLPAGIQLETSVAPGLLRARADRGQIEQVLLNLAINARDAMPDGGTITMAAAPGSTPVTVTLSVSDTGTGMDAATVERCFEPFFTTKSLGHGTGLGLAGVYGIVAQHEGNVTVHSTVGHGTTFVIELPATPESVAQAGRPTETTLGGSETILLVEDQPAVRALISQVLRGYGYDVIVAADGIAGLAAAAASDRPIDLLLTDVVMPGLAGAELAARLNERLPDLPVLYISGYARGALEHRGSIDDEIAFLPKPFNPVELGRKVRTILDGR